MEKRIELEKRARKPNQITELNLDNCRSTSIVGLTDEYTALESLSLINVGLTTLKGFPKLPNLKRLELSDNRISNGLNYLTTSPKLQSLNLSGNKIKDLGTLEPLQEFKHLSVLDLFNNEATQIDNYREKIFEMLPSLKFLDGFDCNEVEAPSDGDDDDEVNGNDSEDDAAKQSANCLNGLEIDLDELAELERRVKAKQVKQTAATVEKHANVETSKPHDVIEAEDDLDLYLAELKIKEAAAEANANANANNAAANSDKIICDNDDAQRSPINYAILLYWFLAILNVAQATIYSGDGEDDDEDGEDDDDDIESDDENDSYGEDDEDDDIESDEENDTSADEGRAAKTGAKDGAKVKQNNAENDSADAAESEARGKKRKHDG